MWNLPARFVNHRQGRKSISHVDRRLEVAQLCGKVRGHHLVRKCVEALREMEVVDRRQLATCAGMQACCGGEDARGFEWC